MNAPAEFARFFHNHDLLPLECLRAHYVAHRFVPHFHEEYVLSVLTDGVETYHHRGGLRRAGPGMISLIQPGEVHTGEAGVEEGWAYRVFYPPAALLADIAQMLTGRPGSVPDFGEVLVHDPPLAHQLALAHQALESEPDRLLRETRLYQALTALLLRYGRCRVTDTPDAGHRLDTARALLADRLAENLSLAEVAAASGLSVYHFSRQFRARFGLPPVAWRNQLRIARSRGLLAAGKSPAEVALLLGFADQAHFSRAFRQVVGLPPGLYRTMNRP
ncbi:AraC family transcriptional regulator [Gulbenkiania mobilis]|uniref:AraC-like DNA-binding protein n=1 Tax=Gulbenkiania mobilis TaxID=397457 RepID=A0ABY2D279_GULMO|nr:AraC-like DNA-binding protein [Gulbenkiania mobilis]